MSHRALVAYARPDGRDDWHLAPWGGETDLRDHIKADRPFADGAVRPERLAVLPFEEGVARLDHLLVEAVYRVASDWTVTAFLPVWGDCLGPGPLVELPPAEGLAALREYAHGARRALCALVADGVLSLGAGRKRLVGALEARVGADQVRAGDAPL